MPEKHAQTHWNGKPADDRKNHKGEGCGTSLESNPGLLRTGKVASEVCAGDGGVAPHGGVYGASRGPGIVVVVQSVDDGRVRHLHVERSSPRRTVACPAPHDSLYT